MAVLIGRTAGLFVRLLARDCYKRPLFSNSVSVFDAVCVRQCLSVRLTCGLATIYYFCEPRCLPICLPVCFFVPNSKTKRYQKIKVVV